MDYFLKATSEAELLAELISAQVLLETTFPVTEIIDGVPTQTGELAVQAIADGFALDVIGTIYKATGQMLKVDGMDVPEMGPIEGYHANLRGVLSDTQLAILEEILLPVPPANPYRVFG